MKSILLRFLFVITIVVPIAMLSGCSSEGNVGDEVSTATANTITVTADPTSIYPGGESSTIEATVTDSDGDGVQGIAVTFSTSLGTLDDTSVVTNTQGIASTVLTSGVDTGTATVTASATGLTDATTTVTITRVPANIAVTADPTSIWDNSSTIEATVTDSDGVGVPGVPVTFSTTLGTLTDTSVDTDAQGIASTVLASGDDAGTATVTASATGLTDATTTVTISPAFANITLSAGPSSICTWSNSSIEATVTDSDGVGVPGVIVTFSTTLGTLTDTTVDTDAQGVASTVLTSDDDTANGAPVHIWAEIDLGGDTYISKLYVSGDTIYAATDGGGIFRSTDSGVSWEHIGRPKISEDGQGLWGTYINDISVNIDGGLNYVMVATENGGVLFSEDGGLNWTNFGSLSDTYTESKSITVPKGTADLTYHAVNRRGRVEVTDANGSPYYYWDINDKTFSVADAGSYDITYDIDYGMCSKTAKIIKRYDNNTYFAHFYGKGIYKFLKADNYWESFKNIASTSISTIAIIPGVDTDYIYVTVTEEAESTVYRSDVGAANFSSVGSSQAVSFNDTFVLGTDIYYASNDQIRKFDTSDNSWQTISATSCKYPNDIKQVWAVDINTIYAATDYGLYRFEYDGSWYVYPLNVCEEEQTPASDITGLTLSYSSDTDKTHTTIYVNGEEVAGTEYSFTDSKTISFTDSISSGSTVQILYTLKSNDSSSVYTSAPEEKITALYYDSDSTYLYFGTENRKLYCIENPAVASKCDSNLPKIKDISGIKEIPGETTKITSTLYKTAEVMFTGNTQVYALCDTDGDDFYDNGNIIVPDDGSQTISVVISDENGRPLVAGSRLEVSTSVGGVSPTELELGDEQYGPTLFEITLYDIDPGNTDPDPESGTVTISVTSDNGDETLPPIDISVN